MNEIFSELFSKNMITILMNVILPFVVSVLVTLLTQYVINNKWPHIFTKRSSHKLQIIKEFCPKALITKDKIPKSYKKSRKIFLSFSYNGESQIGETEISYQIISSFDFTKVASESVEILILNNKSPSLYTIKYFIFANGMRCYINDNDYKYIEEGDTLIICYNKKYSPDKLIICGNGFDNEFDLQKGNDELFPSIKRVRKKRSIKRWIYKIKR